MGHVGDESVESVESDENDLERIYGSVCEPKMAANAEMRPGAQYPLMSLVFGLTRKTHRLQ